MKTKMKTELVRVKYWACLDPAHRHQTEPVAALCIEKVLNAQSGRKSREYEYDDILKQYRSGTRLVDLARNLDLSPTRVRQILNKAEHNERRAKDEISLNTLSIRACNCLMAQGLETPSQIMYAMEISKLRGIEGLGSKSRSEVAAWIDSIHPSRADKSSPRKTRTT